MTSAANFVVMALGYTILHSVQRIPRSIQPRDLQTGIASLYASAVRAVLSGGAHR